MAQASKDKIGTRYVFTSVRTLVNPVDPEDLKQIHALQDAIKVSQLKVFRWVYPREALLVALILAFVPYLLLRSAVNRLARLWRSGNTAAERDSRWSRGRVGIAIRERERVT